jgi:hypothetical protein
MYDTDAIITINGKEYSVQSLIDKLENMGYSEKWIDFANRNSDFIDSFFVVYRAEIATSPEDEDGRRDRNDKSNVIGQGYIKREYEEGTYEIDTVSSTQYEQFEEFLKDLIMTFKI